MTRFLLRCLSISGLILLANTLSYAASSSTSSSSGASTSAKSDCYECNLPGYIKEPVLIYPNQIKWSASSAEPMTDAWVLGANEKPGAYIFRVKMLKKGDVMPPHVHPDERNTTVLNGTLYVGFGPKFDPAKVHPLPKGGVYVVPANVPHYIWAKDGPVEYQEAGVGPTTTTILKSDSGSSKSSSSSN